MPTPRKLPSPPRDTGNNGTAEPGESLYKAALARMTPEMREAFIDACLVAGIAEEDVIHALVLCQAKVMDAGFQGHAKEVAAAVRQELGNLVQRLDRIQRERAEADAKQTEFLSSQLEEIRRRESKVAAEQSKAWQEKALNYTLAFGVGLIVSPFLSAGIDAIRRFIHL
jgi:BMFP domain-containing protein YqiC